MNILKFEIKRNAKVTYIWIIAVVAISIMYLSIGPMFTEDSTALMGALESFGPEVRAAIGIDLDTFFSPVGFYAYVGGFITLALCVQAMIYGIKAFALEKNQKSVDFLYTKPVSRTNLYIYKVLSNVFLLILTQIIVIFMLYGATDLFNKGDYDHGLMLLMLFAIVPMQYLFLGLGVLIGVTVPKLKNVVAVSLFVTMAMYILNMLSAMFENKAITVVSFFHYFNLSDILQAKAFNAASVVGTIILLVLMFGGSYLIINKRDLRAA